MLNYLKQRARNDPISWEININLPNMCIGEKHLRAVIFTLVLGYIILKIARQALKEKQAAV